MKKQIIKVLSLAMVLVMTIAFAGCGATEETDDVDATVEVDTTDDVDANADADTTDDTDVTDDADATDDVDATVDADITDDADVTVESDDTAETMPYATLEEFVNSDEIQQGMEEIIASLKDSGMGMKVYAEGNAFVYEYTYESVVFDDLEAAAALLDENLIAQEATFDAVAEQMGSAIGSTEVTVLVRYLTNEGELITEMEFSPND